MRRILCAILCLAMVCSCIAAGKPSGKPAAKAYKGTYERGDVIVKDSVVYWVAYCKKTTTGLSGAVVVMGMEKKKKIENKAKKNKKEKKVEEEVHGDVVIPRYLIVGQDSISVPKGGIVKVLGNVADRITENTLRIVGINDYAFKGCKMKSLWMPPMDYIGDGAFEKVELANGYLYVPHTKKIGKDAFLGLKSKVVFLPYTAMGENIGTGGESYKTEFDKTFESKKEQPDIYIPSYMYRFYKKDMPHEDLYTYGEKLRDTLLARGGVNVTLDLHTAISVNTAAQNWLGINKMVRADDYWTITLIDSKDFEKLGDARDRYAPQVYSVVRKRYGKKTDVYSGYESNDDIVRFEREGNYYYYTTDGKPRDRTEVADAKGKDPFGAQIIDKKGGKK